MSTALPVTCTFTIVLFSLNARSPQRNLPPDKTSPGEMKDFFKVAAPPNVLKRTVQTKKQSMRPDTGAPNLPGRAHTSGELVAPLQDVA